MTRVTFTVPGKPHGKGRARFANGHAYTDKKTREYEEFVGYCYLAAGNKILSGDIKLSIRAYYHIPKTINKEKVDEKTKQKMLKGEIKPGKPDLSNVVKAIEDGLNQVAYEDDSCITDYGESFKRYSDKPRVEVTLEVI